MAGNRVEKLIINLDTEMPLSCAWDDCPRRARTSYQVRVHEHVCKCSEIELYGGRHYIYAFCCEGHRDYFVASSGPNAHRTASDRRGRVYGQHSAGMSRTMI